MKACYYVDFKSPEDINLKYDNYLYLSVDSFFYRYRKKVGVQNKI